MADEENNSQAGAAQVGGDQSGAASQGAQLTLQKLFIKDVSFEAPNAPEIFREEAEQQVSLNVSPTHRDLGEGLYEVVLTLTVTAKLGEKTAYLAEVQQGGVFQIQGIAGDQLDAALGGYCPGILYPYGRMMISTLVEHGGFPQLLLQPINFEALYAQRQQQQQQAGA